MSTFPLNSNGQICKAVSKRKKYQIIKYQELIENLCTLYTNADLDTCLEIYYYVLKNDKMFQMECTALFWLKRELQCKNQFALRKKESRKKKIEKK